MQSLFNVFYLRSGIKRQLSKTTNLAQLRYHNTNAKTMCGVQTSQEEKKEEKPYDRTSSSSTPPPCNEIQDIEDIHKQAISTKSNTYKDPPTGFTVFTEYAHLKRGKCCGNICRHCPYGWENVTYKKNGKVIRKQAKVKSGDKENVKILLDKIENGKYYDEKEIGLSSTDVTGDDSDEHDQESSTEHNSCQTNEKQTKRQLGKGGRKGGTYTSKNVPYTRTGDEGTSILLSGERRSKDDLAFEAMGTVDELCTVVGVAHAELVANTETNNVNYGDLEEWLVETMSRLFDVGSHIAKPRRKTTNGSSTDDDSDEDSDDDDDDDGEGGISKFTADGIGGGFSEDHVLIIEEWIDVMTEQLPELFSFILPTGGKLSAQLHVARTVCRRAERRVLPLVKEGVCDPNAMRYLNRLSDFFFTAARMANSCEGKDEVQYRRYFKGAKQRGIVKTSFGREEKKDS